MAIFEMGMPLKLPNIPLARYSAITAGINKRFGFYGHDVLIKSAWYSLEKIFRQKIRILK